MVSKPGEQGCGVVVGKRGISTLLNTRKKVGFASQTKWSLFVYEDVYWHISQPVE